MEEVVLVFSAKRLVDVVSSTPGAWWPVQEVIPEEAQFLVGLGGLVKLLGFSARQLMLEEESEACSGTHAAQQPSTRRQAACAP